MRFRVLGIVGMESEDGVAAEVRGNGRALLAALTLTPNRPVPADVLIDAVWGEAGAPRSTLHVEVSRLRTWIRNQGGRPECLANTPAGYRLDVMPEQLDSTLIERLVRRAEVLLAGGETGAALEALSEAVETWGVPYAGLSYQPPFDAVAAELRELGARADELLSEAQLATGKVDIGRLRRLVDEEMTREVRWQHLMLALYRDGRQADALRVFRHATEQLAEVGLAPSQSLVDLEDAILSRDPGLDAISRLELPAEVTTFVGRDEAVEQVSALVEKRRLLCLTGPGGVGKSRLALRVAHRLADRFPDGAAFVSLAHVSDPSMVAISVAAELGAGHRSGVPTAEAIAESVRGRSLLIVLDNCEHVSDSAAQMARLLAAASDTISVIATSQHDLRVPGFVVWNLSPMDVPNTERAAELMGNDAVRLFVERAGERSRRRVDDDPLAIASICRRLDGIPLAIELAATLCTSRTVQEILAMLAEDQRVRVPVTADDIEHHRSWHDSISWSLGLLHSDERRALGRLAVFRGGFDRSAALDVCSGGQLDRNTLDLLIDSLVGKSVLIVTEDESALRLGMLESVRLASIDLIDPGELAPLVSSHRGYFAGRALQEGARMYQATAAAVAAIEADHDNIRAALRAALTGDGVCGIEPDLAVASAMVGVLMPYWTTQGHAEEAQRWADELAELVDPSVSPEVALSAGTAAAFNADYGRSLGLLEVAQASLEAAGRKTLLAWARFQAGRALTVGVIAGMIDVESLERGAELLQQARERFVERGDLHGASLAAMFGGVNAFLRLDVEADRLLDEAFADARRVDAVDVEAMALAMTALPRLRDAEFRVACGRFGDSATALRRDRNWLNTQICTSLAAYAAACAGMDDALRLAAEACRLQLVFGSPEWDALTLTATAMVFLDRDEHIAIRIVRTLDHHYPKWRQLVKGGFAELAPLTQVGPGAPEPILSPAEAQRMAAELLEPNHESVVAGR